MKLTHKSLVERGRHWQRVLRLQDWDLTFMIVNAEDIVGVGQGNISCVFRAAKIQVLNYDDTQRRAKGSSIEILLCDWELTLVHELLHLVLSDVTPGGVTDPSPQHTALERGIDAISRALVADQREFVKGKTAKKGR